MPPGRRGRPAGSTNNRTSARTPQQRLSFGPNATNKITKPSPLGGSNSKEGKAKLSPTQKKAVEEVVVSASESKSPSPAPEVEEDDGEEQTSKKLPIRRSNLQQSDVGDVGEKVEETRDEKETLALKVSEAQIRRFWAQNEENRIVKRVHQEGMTVHEKVLREWDLSSQYGSCIGISRTNRWKRADRLGLRPPLEVLAVLVKEEEKSKGDGGVQIAYMDKLMGGKGVKVEA